MNIFGTLSRTVELVGREEMKDGTVKTVLRYGKLTVVGISNKPSSEALQQLTNGMNRIAAEETEEIRSLEKTLAVIETEKTDDDRLSAIRRFKEAWNEKDICRKELNTLAKEIIDRIELIREGDEVQVKIRFL